jgi:hypothetical protein
VAGEFSADVPETAESGFLDFLVGKSGNISEIRGKFGNSPSVFTRWTVYVLVVVAWNRSVTQMTCRRILTVRRSVVRFNRSYQVVIMTIVFANQSTILYAINQM